MPPLLTPPKFLISLLAVLGIKYHCALLFLRVLNFNPSSLLSCQSFLPPPELFYHNFKRRRGEIELRYSSRAHKGGGSSESSVARRLP